MQRALPVGYAGGDARARRMGAAAGWAYEDGALRRQFSFPGFADAMAFVNRVAELAERANHHPDITINYNRVGIALSTHDAGGVAEKDVDLARQIAAAERS